MRTFAISLGILTTLFSCNPNKLVTKGRKHIKAYEGTYVYLTREGMEDYYYQERCDYVEERFIVFPAADNPKAWYLKENKKEGAVEYFIQKAKTADREATLELKKGEEQLNARFYNNRAKEGTQAFALGKVEYGKETYVTPENNPAKLEVRYCYDFNAIFSEYPKKWVKLKKQDTVFVRINLCNGAGEAGLEFVPNEGGKHQLKVQPENKTYTIANGTKEEGTVNINYSKDGFVRHFKLKYHPQKHKVAKLIALPEEPGASMDTTYFAPAAFASNYKVIDEECK